MAPVIPFSRRLVRRRCPGDRVAASLFLDGGDDVTAAGATEVVMIVIQIQGETCQP